MTRVEMKHIIVPTGFTKVDVDNFFMGVLPDRIFLAMVTNDAFSGTWDTNPFNFQHFNLRSASLLVNGEQIPRISSTYDFSATGDESYKRAYNNLLEVLGIDIGDRNLIIDSKDFANGFAIFGFKITPGPVPGTPARNGNIRLHLDFAEALAKNLTIITLAEYSGGRAEIDRNSNVIIA